MIYYLGNKVKINISDKERETHNRLKNWRYGYDAKHDIVIISKDGTLGEVYEIMGLKIGLPEPPKKEDIINSKKIASQQKFKRESMPKELEYSSIDKYTSKFTGTAQKRQEQIDDYLQRLFTKHKDYIDEQYEKRDKGVWIYLNGKLVYLTGTYWFGIQWCRELSEYPNLRIIQNELMIFWEACKADQRCYGMQYVKNRRMGASLLAIIEMLDAATLSEDKLLGMISKKGEDASKIFRRYIAAFKRLPSFFRPVWDGTNNPKKKLNLEEATRRKSAGSSISMGNGLGTMVEWHNTDLNAMDGDAIFRSLIDECYAPGTKILCDGMVFRKIEDIKVGDTVIVEGGKKVKVAKTTRGKTEMFKVSQPYAKDYIVSRNHRLYLEQRCRVKSIHDDGIKIMKPQEFIELGKYRKRTTFGVRSKGLDFDYLKVPIDPYMLGIWLGDGDSQCSRIIVNNEKDPEIVDYIKNFCKKTGHNLSVRKSSGSDKCSLYAILRKKDRFNKNGKWHKNRFTQSLKDINVLNNKHIPKSYIQNSKKVRLELLAGIIDTDGCLNFKNKSYRYELASASKQLAQDYAILSRSLGFKTVVKKRISNHNTKYWAIHISGNDLNIPCRVVRKIIPSDYKRQYANHINKINIESIGLGSYYGIQVEANNDNERRLILEDFTISMNSGKYPKDVPFSKYWGIVRTSHRKGVIITGKSMVVSTVNSLKKGGAEYKKIWDQSNCEERDANGQTKSGLYRIFIPAKYCLEGMFDQYGFSILEDSKKAIKTDEGVYVKTGSKTWLKNNIDALQDDPDELNEFMRQNPETINDAFRNESGDCEFNEIKIDEQIDHNLHELNDTYNSETRKWEGNDDVDRGNFSWEDGIRFGTVRWNPDPKGRFYIKRGCHPPKEFRNQYEEIRKNGGVLAKSPLAGHIGTFGVDPYNRSKNADGRGSNGAIILKTKTHTCDDLPNNCQILEYIDRPKKVEQFFEDVIMACIYYSMPFLSELSNERFLHKIKDWGFRHYSMNNPFKKTWDDLSPTEKEVGGAPQQDAKIGEAQFYATEAFIEDHVGVARDSTYRQIGEMGNMPFTRTLYDYKEVDTNNRTKFDAYIAASLSDVGNQKRTVRKNTEQRRISVPFAKYDNTGAVSKLAV